MQFFGKFGKIVCWRPPPPPPPSSAGLASPPTGNPGSAPVKWKNTLIVTRYVIVLRISTITFISDFSRTVLSHTNRLWGMYKRSEPITSLHSVKNHMANFYSSEVCLQTKKFPKISKFFFLKNTPKYDKLSKISNISIKTMLELRTKFGNFGNFGHISDGLRKQYSVRTQCCNLIGSEPLYIPCSEPP